MQVFIGALFLPALLVEATVPQKIATDTTKFCTGVTVATPPNEREQAMLENLIGDPNIVSASLVDRKCDGASGCWSKYQDTVITRVLLVFAPGILAILTLLLWIILGSCACCRCCRRCSIWCCCKEKSYPGNMSKCKKMVIMMYTFLFIGLVAVGLAFALPFKTKMTNGAESAVCRAFEVADDTINGVQFTSANVQHTFIGTTTLATKIDSLSTLLGENSSAMTAIKQTVDQTIPMENATKKLKMYFKTMKETLGLESIINVGDHQCFFCYSCCSGTDSAVDQVVLALDNSFASAVNKLRDSIQEQLTGDGLTSLRESVSDINDNIASIKKRIEDTMAENLLNNSSSLESGLNLMKIVATVLVAAIAIPALFLLISIIFGVCRSARPSYSDPTIKPQNPCHASCGWCVSFFYAFIILLLSGLFLLSGYVETMLCDVLASKDTLIDGQLGDGSDPTLKNVADACLKSTGSGDLLGSIVIDTTTGKTAKDFLNSALDIDSLFASADTASTTIPSVASEPNFATLMNSMDEYGSLYMIPADRIAFLKTRLGAGQTPLPSNYNDIMKAAYGGVPQCTAPGAKNLARTSMGAWFEAALVAAGYTFSGNGASNNQAFTFKTALEYANLLNTGGVSFNQNNACPSTGFTETAKAPYSNLLFAKNQVINKTDFKCATVSLQSTATDGRETYVANVGNCNYSAFVTYVASLRSWILAAATNLDTVATATSTSITNNIRQIIQTQVLPPAQDVMNGSDCAFVPKAYDNLQQALCWQHDTGFVGYAYMLGLLGVSTLIAIFAMFIIWRHLKDNISLWRDVIQGQTNRRSPTMRTATTVRPVAVPRPLGQAVVNKNSMY